MHHIKSQAKQSAWKDPNNPFGRKRAPSKRNSNISRAEEGNSNALSHTNSAPQNFRPGSRENETGFNREIPQSSFTAPNVNSKLRSSEINDGDQIERTMSPEDDSAAYQTLDEKKTRYNTGSELTDRTLTEDRPVPQSENTTETEKPHRKRNLMSFLGGKGEDRKEEMEKQSTKDDNGKAKPHFTFANQIRATLLNSWINVLLICSPVGIALYYAKVSPYAVFVINFIAIIPLAGMLSYATEEIALRVGEVLGGLLNASFGNAVELIVSIIALLQGQILIVQTSLIGSMFSNLLLVMGMCFFAGGINRVEQAFNMTVAQTAASLLFLAVSSLIIPTAFQQFVDTSDSNSVNETLVYGEAELSRATAILLLFVYACYLFFQLKSHSGMYNAPSEKNEKRDFTVKKRKWKGRFHSKVLRRGSAVSVSPTPSQKARDAEDADDGPEEPRLHIWVAVGTLALTTVFVALNAEYLVDSINAITCEGGISKNFVGLILLPIVGNAAEHATAVTVAIKDKMDLAIGVAVGSSMQIALLVLPFIVVLGWIIGQDRMTLYFDGFQITMLFVAVLLVNYLIQDGKSHWLEGVLLMVLYVIIAVSAWFYPAAADQCGSG